MSEEEILEKLKMSEEEIFETLKSEHPIDELVKFDETDIHQKLQDNAFQVVRYKEFYYKELSIYEDLERKMDALRGQRYSYYKFNDEREFNKKEIEDYCLPADKDVLTMKRIMKKQLIRVRFFEMCWKAFDKVSWNMKTYQDRERMGL